MSMDKAVSRAISMPEKNNSVLEQAEEKEKVKLPYPIYRTRVIIDRK